MEEADLFSKIGSFILQVVIPIGGFIGILLNFYINLREQRRKENKDKEEKTRTLAEGPSKAEHEEMQRMIDMQDYIAKYNDNQERERQRRKLRKEEEEAEKQKLFEIVRPIDESIKNLMDCRDPFNMFRCIRQVQLVFDQAERTMAYSTYPQILSIGANLRNVIEITSKTEIRLRNNYSNFIYLLEPSGDQPINAIKQKELEKNLGEDYLRVHRILDDVRVNIKKEVDIIHLLLSEIKLRREPGGDIL